MLATQNGLGRRIYVRDDDPCGVALVGAAGDLNPMSLSIWNRLVAFDRWSTVIDVGANYGEMILGAKIPAGARAWAFEPAPRVVECLTRSVAESGIGVSIVQKAVGAASGTITLYEDPSWSGTTTASPGHGSPGSVAQPVQAVRLDEFLIAAGLSASERVLVKIDVEGGERDALVGLKGVAPLVERLVVQAEIARCSDEDLSWIIANYVLHLISLDGLRPMPVASVRDLRRLQSTGRFYAQDGLLAADVIGRI